MGLAIIYGISYIWTLKLDQQRRLRSVQRKMLRMVLNAKRWKLQASSSQESSENEDEADEIDTLEPWPDFLRRTARWTEEQLEKAGQQEWLAIWRTRQWRWACKLVTKDTEKWSAVATTWQPFIHSSCRRGRAQARPKKRWDQDIVSFLETEFPDKREGWQTLARDEVEWLKLGERFTKSMCDGM